MKYWIYCEPAGERTSEAAWTILSEKAILDTYWTYWSEKMIALHGDIELSTDQCIQDWITVHWAVEATPDSLLRIIKDGQ